MKMRIKKIQYASAIFISLLLLVVMALASPLTAFAEVGIGKTQADYGPIYIESEYQTKEEMMQAAMETAEDISREGIVLLKNDNESLPLASNTTINFVGGMSLTYAGGGSSGTIQTTFTDYKTYLTSELTNAGLKYTTKTADTSVPDTATEGTACVVISQSGSENYDNGLTRESSEAQDGGHSLRLTATELKNIRYAANNYTNVIIMFNMGTQFEAGFVTDPESYFAAGTGVMPTDVESSYAYGMTDKEIQNMKDHINSAILVGFPGDAGCTGIAEVLSGATNPSGRTTSTWYNDFTLDPTFQNFGSNGTATGTGKTANDSATGNTGADGGKYVHYDEDIYMGYRYYETRSFTDGEDWYQANMNFPFGHGLSYTTFSKEIISTSYANNAILDEEGTITVNVKVTNTGLVSGKEVVQLYYNAPYTTGGIAKSHVVLGAFNKTSLLEPNASETLTLTMKVEDMKSYDWKDANNNDITGYELEKGTYNLFVSDNAHSWYDISDNLKLSYTVAEDIHYKYDSTTGTEINNIYDDMSYGVSYMDSLDGIDDDDERYGITTYFSRDDWNGTFPTNGTSDDKQGLDQLRETISSSYYDDENMPWYVDPDDMPSQATVSGTSETNTIKLLHVSGRDYNDPLWDELLDQLTVDEMIYLLKDGFGQTLAIDSIGKPLTYDDDGPMGWTTHSYTVQDEWEETEYVFRYSSGTLVAQTYNIDLMYERGKMQGMEGTLGNIHSQNYYQYSGCYAPGANIHRSPFGGRNFEYFSEDPYVSGKTAANIIDGMQDQGVYCYYKHFFLNEQETNRETLSTWASEQVMREIYAKGFEIGVKEGQPTALMSSLAYMGRTITTESYATHVTLLRDEWGFQGMVLTDWKSPVDARSSVRTGVDLILNNSTSAYTQLNAASETATFVTAIRESTHNVLFAVANSNAMNGMTATALYSTNNGGSSMTTTIGSAFSGTVNEMASNGSNTPYNYTITSGSLPEGLVLDEETGAITGNVSAEEGIYNFTVLAQETDQAVLSREFLFLPYSDVEANFSITVIESANDALIFLDNTIATDIVAGVETTLSIASAVYFDADGNQIKTGITYALAEGETMPTGLTLSSAGIITGTSEIETETYTIDVVATYGTTYTKTASITFNVVEQIIVYEKADTTEWELYVGTATSIDVGGATGASNITYSISSSTPLPSGLSITSTTGEIAGTPSKACTDYEIILNINGYGAEQLSVTYELTIIGIEASDVTINAQVDKGFSYDFLAAVNDGTDSKVYYSATFDISGVVMSTNGKIVGRIDTTGTYNITVSVNSVGYSTVRFTLTIVVYDPDTNAN